MKVTLLAHSPDLERLVAAAAKICYSPSGIDTVFDRLTPDKTEQFLNLLSDMGHESPIEHASFTFGIEGVSRSLLAQLTRHRMASFSVQSQRYVREGQFGYVVPPAISEIPEAKDLYLAAMERDQKSYDELSSLLFEKHLAALLSSGMGEKAARSAAEKQAIEDARYVLPNACETKLMVTMNARSLLNFFRLRCCNRAQWEIRELAHQMLALCLATAPALFAHAGPSCADGACSEGRMSCGKGAEMRAAIGALRENACDQAGRMDKQEK